MQRFDILREQLLELVPQNSVCAELGVGRGVYSQQILDIAKPKLHYCVDLWGIIDTDVQGTYYANQKVWDERYADIQQQFKDYNVEFVRDYTYNLPNYVKDKALDWVYIDGDHTYDGCMKDLQAVKHLVKDDGFILGHDYRPAWKARPNWGVVESVNDFVAENNYYLTIVTNEKHASYFITKTQSQHEEITERAKQLG